MAEIVAFGASVVAFVQLADRVINLSKFYLEALHDCPHDIKTVLAEITSLKALLETLNFLIRLEVDASHASSILTRFGGQNGPVEGCRNAMAMLEKLIPSHTRAPPQKGKKATELLKYLAWPLHQTKATKLLILRESALVVFVTVPNFHLVDGRGEAMIGTNERGDRRDIKDIKANLSEIGRTLTVS